MSDTLAQWVALSLIPGLGAKTIAALLAHFGSLDTIFSAEADDLRAVERIGPKLAAAIRAADLEHTRAAIDRWQAQGIALLRPGEPGYPPALAALPDAPPVLFRRGLEVLAETRAIAVVGTRHPSPAARDYAVQLAAAIAARGWIVVSGMASGTDSAAHQGALQAGGQTVAVLGGGVCAPYPPDNAALARRIAAQGALLSETHPQAAPNSPALVARNRLISGLSRAVVVIEAGGGSGSLHAARFAQAQGRALYAVDNGVEGNSLLLGQGAGALPAAGVAWEALAEWLLKG